MTKKIMMSAGEISGDIYGGRLVVELRKLDPTLQFFGMGSQRMLAAGVTLFSDLSDISTIGFVEPLCHIPRIYFTYLKMKKRMAMEKPDLVIPIDFQGYNLLLCKAAKQLSIPSIYYISPQEWQWGSDDGGRKVVDVTTKILSIFQQEADFYHRLGGDATYIGHPILDLAQSSIDKSVFYQSLGIPENQRIISIFPGSRPQELTYTLPLLVKVARYLEERLPDLHIVICLASSRFRSRIQDVLATTRLKAVTMYSGNQYDLIKHTTLSLVTSGTVTLEHAVMGTPCLAHYRFSKLSYQVLKWVLAEKVKRFNYISLPNILLQEVIMPEFLQDTATVENSGAVALHLLCDAAAYAEAKQKLSRVLPLLGTPGVIARAAKIIIDSIK